MKTKKKSVLGPQRVALITGGSSGIGLATARLLAREGNHVWLMARDAGRLEEAVALLERERTEAGQQFGALQADVANADQVFAALNRIEVETGTPDLVINSAGETYPGYVQDLDLQTFYELMEVNYFGCVHVTKAILPQMIARRSGHLVFISSLGGLISVFGYTAYSASKFALQGFADALRQEMKPYGIRISVVAPPDTDTPQLAFENQFKPFETRAIVGNAKVVSSEFVAKEMLQGIARRKYLIIPGLNPKFFFILKRFLGSGFDIGLDIIIARARRNGHSSFGG